MKSTKPVCNHKLIDKDVLITNGGVYYKCVKCNEYVGPFEGPTSGTGGCGGNVNITCGAIGGGGGKTNGEGGGSGETGGHNFIFPNPPKA